MMVIENEFKKNKNIRYHVLDELRGFLILNMIVYHMLWDLVYLYGVSIEWYQGYWGFLWQQWGCHFFILLSGFCWQMGKKHLKRGMLVFGAGFFITVITLLILPGSRVIFGVLTFTGSAMLFMIPVSKLLDKLHSGIGIAVTFLLFIFSHSVNSGYLGIGKLVCIQLPKNWYSNLFSTYLGFPEKEFWSTDYFSIFPWIFLYIIGYFGYSILKRKEWLGWAKKGICPPLGFLGRNSLVFYMIHQPIIYGVCLLVFGY